MIPRLTLLRGQAMVTNGAQTICIPLPNNGSNQVLWGRGGYKYNMHSFTLLKREDLSLPVNSPSWWFLSIWEALRQAVFLRSSLA